MNDVINILKTNTVAFELINILQRVEDDFEFDTSGVLTDDLIYLSEKFIGRSKQQETDSKKAISDLKRLVKNPTTVKAFMKKQNILLAIGRDKNKLIEQFIPVLKKEHNKIHTVLKLLTAVNQRVQFEDVRVTFAEGTKIPYLNNYERKTLKSFNIFRNMLMHQDTDNVFTSEHWVSINKNMIDVKSIIENLMEKYEKPLTKKIFDASFQDFKTNSGFAEIHDLFDEKVSEREMRNYFKK